ncbi:MAG: hypothetical protein JWO65_2263 [Sphingomonas bacterium]|nr:hypothetical protein [Sphingomonas bacterium]
MRRIVALASGLLCLCACRSTLFSESAPAGYPNSYADEVHDADREGVLAIWSAIDKQKAAALVADFARLHPDIHVRYQELPARQLYDRFLANAAAGGGTADFLWSSAMDLQIKLVNDGYTQRYVSPEREALPHWANWKNQAWGTTAEPIVFLYNRRLIADAAMPRGHEALIRFLEQRPQALRGRVATYDVASSAVGYLYLSQDQQAVHDIWRLVRAMGEDHVALYANAEQAVREVASGRAAVAYDIVGSYALGQVQAHPDIGMVVPRDYTLLMSRIAVIPAAARHPNAARLFLDFLLSRRGQGHLVRENMPSVRADVPGPPALDPAGAPLRAIRVGPALLVSQDLLTRQYFLRRWRAALGQAG